MPWLVKPKIHVINKIDMFAKSAEIGLDHQMIIDQNMINDFVINRLKFIATTL